MLRTVAIAGLVLLGFLLPRARGNADERVSETEELLKISLPNLEAAIRKQGYVTGVAAQSLLDKKTGFRDAGFGLDIVDWIMEPGSDEAYRDKLEKELVYAFNNDYHGKTPKRSIEGPQICTQAKRLEPRVIRGKDFVAVQMRYVYTLAAPGKQAGSIWEQTLVFPNGKRWFYAADKVTLANDGEGTALRVDIPGHIRHRAGDRFARVYMSYEGVMANDRFLKDFAPDAQFRYVRKAGEVPKRFIRAYRLRDPRTGKEGPWLAGMTLRPDVVSEAWCHQRGYVSMIEEIGGGSYRKGDQIRAAYLIGYFDSLEAMDRTFDNEAGPIGIDVTADAWKLVR
jgi:hypothetical protein